MKRVPGIKVTPYVLFSSLLLVTLPPPLNRLLVTSPSPHD
jgi:hypothetical protein